MGRKGISHCSCAANSIAFRSLQGRAPREPSSGWSVDASAGCSSFWTLSKSVSKYPHHTVQSHGIAISAATANHLALQQPSSVLTVFVCLYTRYTMRPPIPTLPCLQSGWTTPGVGCGFPAGNFVVVSSSACYDGGTKQLILSMAFMIQ